MNSLINIAFWESIAAKDNVFLKINTYIYNIGGGGGGGACVRASVCVCVHVCVYLGAIYCF